MQRREDYEGWQEKILAPHAAKSRHSLGREHPEAEHPLRTAFQRDRDRIVHSTAFRRLEYKTQVFVNHEGDHYRTRLTHTLEVAQMARTIARALRLNEDLAEAIALAHDLGHAPFGHSGETVLNELMAEHGGFEHNRQALRIVEHLEERYPGFRGLNLTWETREGIIKHSGSYDLPSWADLSQSPFPSLEAMVVNAADEIAYNNHDIDDGLRSELFTAAELKGVELWEDNYRRLLSENPHSSPRLLQFQTIRHIINEQVEDVIETTSQRIGERHIRSIEDVRGRGGGLVAFSPRMAERNQVLKEFLMQYMYKNYRVVRMEDKAKRIIRELFKAYVGRPEQLPPHVYARASEEGLERMICDYIAGMTDRFAQDEYKKLFDPHERV